MADVLETSEDAFEADVLKSDTPVLVDFWAPWCGPCKMVAPVVAELASDYDGKLKVVKVNVDDNPALSVKYQVRGIPTLLIFNEGEVAQQVVGYVPKAALAEKVDAVLAG
jgi:thioredoxin 1